MKPSLGAHDRRQAFIDVHQKSSLIELRLLYDMFSHRDWESLGFDRWQEYCEAPVDSGGLAVSREWATQLVQVYKRYVVELGLPEQKLLEVSPRKLYQVKNVVNEDNIEEMLNKVKTLSLKDLSIEIAGLDTVHCAHPRIYDVDAEFLYHCPDCKQYQKLTKEELRRLI